jgi:pyruvate/2-oxoglutarate dehydrogenase complex dihydrolipoamide dehydrogenase (E3) component
MSVQEAQTIAAKVRTSVSQRSVETAARLTAAGVTILNGTAKLRDANTLIVDGQETVTAGNLVLAGGSEPLFQPKVRPTGKRVIAPRHTKTLEEIPPTLVMVGGGITGVEYASAFARLGSKVTLLARRSLLPSWDREYVDRLKGYLEDTGIKIYTGSPVAEVAEGSGEVTVNTTDGRRFAADYAFIATGRSADLESIAESPGALEALGLKTKSGFVTVDASGATSVAGIFACGDMTGPPLIANKALLEARKVAFALTEGRVGVAAGDISLIEAVFTAPQLAQLGPVAAADEDPNLRLERRSYSRLMLAHIQGAVPPGEVKVWLTQEDRIVAAAAIGENAADVLAPVQVALRHKLRWSVLTEIPFAYPTLTEVVTT